MTISSDRIDQTLARVERGEIDPPEWLSVVMLQRIAEALATIAADMTLIRRALDRCYPAFDGTRGREAGSIEPTGVTQRGTDPPQAREFLRRPGRG